jgi:putative ABC transport system ATP-binding protein/lipoprotein-releasing system ATP-binding protein
MSIQMKDLKKSFGSPAISVLKGVTGQIQTGSIVSIVGRSGSGKSTLLYLISSLDRPTSGEVIIDQIPLVSMDSKQLHQFRNLKMGFVFQFHHLLPELTALENVLMPAMKTKTERSRRFSAETLLDEFGIRDKANSFPSQLSGGEQQRVAIARALIMNPTYLFADEPTGNLDSQNGQIVMDIFQRINKEKGTTIIFVTHDLEFAKMADHQIKLSDGLVVE